MRRAAAVLAVCALVALWAPAARAADTAPGPEQIQFAAHEHDLGYRAYMAKQFDEAATHFENAFFAAPNAAELRSAIRARRDAGQLARAASLAAIGQRKYPDDAPLNKFAGETIAEAAPKVYEVRITSPDECNVTVDEKVVAAEKVKDFRFFVDPGQHKLLVGWSEERNLGVSIDARAGGKQTLTLQAPPPPPRPVASSTGPIGSEQQPPSRKPLGPAVFVVGAGLTAVGAGFTVWSGIDTQNHPGTAAVKADCAGQGTSCPEYQQGLDSQRRTNILLAATGGVALVTAVVGVFFTQWSRVDVAPPTGANHLVVEPVVGLGQAALKGTF